MSPLWRVLVASFVLLGSIAVWILVAPGPELPATAVALSTSGVTISQEHFDQDRSAIPPTPSRERPIPLPSTPQTPVTPSPRRSAGPYVSTLELQIRATRSAEERADLITELAHMDSAEAVLALERLFTIERHPKVQSALIASLLDVDPTIQPDARLRILRAALTNQPRDVRTTALEVLAESDDPAARELLRKSSISDPDHEVREVAAALYKANSR